MLPCYEKMAEYEIGWLTLLRGLVCLAFADCAELRTGKWLLLG